MKQQTYNIQQLKTLLPASLTAITPSFKENIAKNGVMVPLIVCDSVVCDGHRRLKAAQELAIVELACINVSGTPGQIFAALNSHRELSAYEIAAIYSQLADTEKSRFFNMAGIAESPQMHFVTGFIAAHILPDATLVQNTLPINIWRELGHLDHEIERFAKPLLQLPGTIGEKRNIAALLRQLQRRHELPDNLGGDCAADVISKLQNRAQPRRSQALEKFNQALALAQLPAGTSIKIDPTLAQPGMQISINITRRHLQRLDQVKEAVEKLFAQVEEL